MTLRNIDALFNAREIAVLGEAKTPAQRQLVDNVRASVGDDRRAHVIATPSIAHLPDCDFECAVITDAAWGAPGIIDALAKRGARAVYWAADARLGDAALCAARPYHLRFLGARSAGVIATRSQLNLSTLALAPTAGRVAMITQSQSLAAAALDWAAGRNIGFSWLACTGAEADIDAGDLLDYAALDPATRAVVLQIDEIASARKFMSAARAAARIKPVLALQTRRAVRGGPLGPDPARSAAFARAGLVECENLSALFDGLVALELLPGVRGERILVLGNGAGVCALGTDALRRQRLTPARAGTATREQLAKAAPAAVDHGASIDLGGSDREQTLAALAAALGDTQADAVLLVHSPVAGHPHAPLVEAIAQQATEPKLMTVWLGLETARAARRASAAARLATFASVDEAVRAVRYRSQYRYTQELLAATPPPDPTVAADVDALRGRLAGLAADGVRCLSAAQATELLAAYGIVGKPAPASALSIRVHAAPHAELGMMLRVADQTLGAAPAYGFAPLDGLLARRLLEDAGIACPRADRAAFDALAGALVRLAKMVVDLAALARADVAVAVGAGGRLCAPADSEIEITDAPRAERERLVLAPYPARMRHRVELKGGRGYQVRAIAPADEPAVLDLLESLSAEEIRLRFFTYIRHFSHDMAARFTQVDYDREVSLVVSPANHPDALAGMGTLIADPDGLQAEFAVLVGHAHTGVGLGRHLLDCLLRAAGARRIPRVYGDVLAGNRPMLALARGLGFRLRHWPDDTASVQVEIDPRDYG